MDSTYSSSVLFFHSVQENSAQIKMDRTGFDQLRRRACLKATSLISCSEGVTIGPEARLKIANEPPPLVVNGKNEELVSSTPIPAKGSRQSGHSNLLPVITLSGPPCLIEDEQRIIFERKGGDRGHFRIETKRLQLKTENNEFEEASRKLEQKRLKEEAERQRLEAEAEILRLKEEEERRLREEERLRKEEEERQLEALREEQRKKEEAEKEEKTRLNHILVSNMTASFKEFLSKFKELKNLASKCESLHSLPKHVNTSSLLAIAKNHFQRCSKKLESGDVVAEDVSQIQSINKRVTEAINILSEAIKETPILNPSSPESGSLCNSASLCDSAPLCDSASVTELRSDVEEEDLSNQMDEETTIEPEEIVVSTNAPKALVPDSRPTTNEIVESQVIKETKQKAPPSIYQTLIDKVSKIEALLMPLENDPALKNFRATCKLNVNTPLNSICHVTEKHLSEKYRQLSAVLSGSKVENGSRKYFSASSHPLGVRYCMSVLASKFVSQGETGLKNTAPESVFALAAVGVSLSMEFPEFGDLLRAQFYKVCPYLIPIYPTRQPGDSEEDYCRRLGFNMDTGEKAQVNLFLKRCSGITQLYFALYMSPPKRGCSNRKTSFTVSDAWNWFASLLNQEPLPNITATVLLEALETIGPSMIRTYGKQFVKLLNFINATFIPKIERVSGSCGMGPVTRLEDFLGKYKPNYNFPPPRGALPSHFW